MNSATGLISIFRSRAAISPPVLKLITWVTGDRSVRSDLGRGRRNGATGGYLLTGWAPPHELFNGFGFYCSA
jgi:hypothetical protein